MSTRAINITGENINRVMFQAILEENLISSAKKLNPDWI